MTKRALILLFSASTSQGVHEISSRYAGLLQNGSSGGAIHNSQQQLQMASPALGPRHWARLPNSLQSVAIENRIGAYQRNVLDLCLRGQQAVEWISVMSTP